MSSRSPLLRSSKILPGRWGDVAATAICAVLIAAFPFVASAKHVDAAALTGISAIVAVGMALLVGQAGQVSMGQAGFFAIGAYAQAILVAEHEWNPLLAMVVAVVATVVLSFLIGAPLLRLRGHYLSLATLGFGIVVGVLGAELDFTGRTTGITGVPPLTFNGRTYDTPFEQFFLVWPIVLVLVLLGRNVVEGRIGRALGAVADSEVAAESLGVNTYRLRLKSFVLAAALAGFAGTLFAHKLLLANHEASRFSLSVHYLLMVVFGGLVSIWGAIIGAIAVDGIDTILKDQLKVLVPSARGEETLIAFGLALAVVMVLMPGGIIEAFRRVTARWRKESVVPDAPVNVRGTHRPRHVGADGREIPDTDTDAVSDTQTERSTGSYVADPLVPKDNASDDEELRVAVDLDTPEVAALLTREGRREPGYRVLEVKDLTKVFGGVHAVQDVSFDAKLGEIVGLIGPNGAGKTTVFNMVSSVLKPTSGVVTLNGTVVSGLKPNKFCRAGAARTFQNLQIFSSMTVRENVMVGRHSRTTSGFLRGATVLFCRGEEKATRTRANQLIDLLGLGDVADTPASSLPFGRQRLVEVARALATEPDVLLLDEPMAGLSGNERRELVRLLRRLREAGMCVVVVEHDIEAVLAMADRVAVLDDGLRIAFGTPAEVRRDPAVIAAYLGEEDTSVAEHVMEEVTQGEVTHGEPVGSGRTDVASTGVALTDVEPTDLEPTDLEPTDLGISGAGPSDTASSVGEHREAGR